MPKERVAWNPRDEQEARFDDALAMMMAETASRPAKAPLDPLANISPRLQTLEAELAWNRRCLELLMQHVRALEAGQASMHSSRRCPACCHLSLNVVATGPHPEFAAEGIEQHEIRCDQCGHQEQRLHDPSGFIC